MIAAGPTRLMSVGITVANDTGCADPRQGFFEVKLGIEMIGRLHIMRSSSPGSKTRIQTMYARQVKTEAKDETVLGGMLDAVRSA